MYVFDVFFLTAEMPLLSRVWPTGRRVGVPYRKCTCCLFVVRVATSSHVSWWRWWYLLLLFSVAACTSFAVSSHILFQAYVLRDADTEEESVGKRSFTNSTSCQQSHIKTDMRAVPDAPDPRPENEDNDSRSSRLKALPGVLNEPCVRSFIVYDHR